MREPLTWPGGVRQSASGLVVEVLTDEGICGIGEAPGPTLPTIRTVIEQELTQFLVGQDPLRTEWLVHRMEEFSRNWSRIAAYAISSSVRKIVAKSTVPRPTGSWAQRFALASERCTCPRRGARRRSAPG